MFLGINAQKNSNVKIKIEEPEFVGESILVRPDGTPVALDKHIAQGRTVASTGLIMTGIGKVRQQIQIEGCCAKVQIQKSEPIELIIRGVDNKTDPLSIIRIFKFEAKKKFRRAELNSANNWGTTKTNNLQFVSFTGKKYKESSYLLKLDKVEPGEYGVIISNPNSLDEKQTVVAAFAVTE